MSQFQAVTTTRVYRKVADQIIEKIRHGEFAPGARLPAERDLAEQLLVSRASIREAFIALELEGYVEVRGGVGVMVRDNQGMVSPLARQAAPHGSGPGSPADALTTPHAPAGETGQGGSSGVASSGGLPVTDVGPFDILETRLLLEPDAAALASHVGLPEQIAAIERAHAAMVDSDNPALQDLAFHQAIAAACGNGALAAAIDHVWQLSLASPLFARLQAHFASHQVWATAHQEHGRIVDAIRDRDPVRARHAMHDHLVGILARLRQDFGKSILFAPPTSGDA